jgi:MFS family permease
MLEWVGIFIVYTLRVNISVAAEAMKPELGWTEVQKGLVLSAFYWGYMAGQIPTIIILQQGWMKGIHVFGISVLVPSILTLLVPVASRYSYVTALLCRCVIGFVESASFPTAFYFFRKWYPENERVVMISVFMSSSYFGEIVGFLLSGVLVESLGWPSVFYVFGALGIIWYPFWFVYAYENPRDHPYMTKDEMAYITAGKYNTVADLLTADDKEAAYGAIKQSDGGNDEDDAMVAKESQNRVIFKNLNVGGEGREDSLTSGPPTSSFLDGDLVEPLMQNDDSSPMHAPSSDDPFRAQRAMSQAQKVNMNEIPWGEILSSGAVWNLLYSNFIVGWLLFTLLSEMPSYLTGKCGFTVGQAGLLSTLPFGALFLVAIGNGYWMDALRNKYGMSKWNQRFFALVLFEIGTPLCLVLCMFFDPEVGNGKWYIYALLVTGTGLVGFQTSSMGVAYLDLLPRFSPMLNTIGNTLGAAAGIIGPVVASELIVSYGVAGWNILFFITAAMSAIGVILWVFYGVSEIDDRLNTPKRVYE